MQTSYPTAMPVAMAGMLADISAVKDVRAVVNEETTTIPYGVAVKQGTGEGKVLNLSAKTDIIVGFILHEQTRRPTDTTTGVAASDVGNLLCKGKCYVKVEDAVNQGDKVYARFGAGVTATADGALDVKGALLKTADTVTAWVKNTAVALKARRALAGKVYECTTAGTTENSDTPALSGQTGSTITDGTAVWAYKGDCDSSSRDSALLVPGATYMSSAAAGAYAVVGFDNLVANQ